MRATFRRCNCHRRKQKKRNSINIEWGNCHYLSCRRAKDLFILVCWLAVWVVSMCKKNTIYLALITLNRMQTRYVEHKRLWMTIWKIDYTVAKTRPSSRNNSCTKNNVHKVSNEWHFFVNKKNFAFISCKVHTKSERLSKRASENETSFHCYTFAYPDSSSLAFNEREEWCNTRENGLY